MTPAELVAQLPMAAFILDLDHLTAANDRLADLLGYTQAEMLGATIERFLPADERERIWKRHKARLGGDAEPQDYQLRLLHKGGDIVPARARVSFFPAAGAEAVVCLISDERERDRTTSLIQGFVDAAAAAVRQSTQADILRVAREQLEALGLTVSTWVVDGDRLHIADVGRPGPFIDKIRERWPDGAPASIFPGPPNIGAYLFIDDLPGMRARIMGMPRATFEGGPPHGMVTTVSVPGGKSLIFSCQGERLDASVASAFGLLGKQLGAALEGALRLEEANQRTGELSLLLELGREVVGALDEEKVVRAAARTAALSLRRACAYVLLPDAQDTVLRVAAREDPEPSPELAVGSEVPLAVDSLATLAYRHCAPYTDSAANRTSMAVPLLSHGRALGVLTLIDRDGRQFDTQDIRLATHAAQLVASALLNSRLYADLRQSYADLARTQAELIDRERMAALGELSASIAHEVRNPLGVIFNSVGTLQRLLRPQGDVALLLEIVGEEADRLNRMVGDLLDYSRPVQPAMEPLSLEPLVKEAISGARRQIGPAAELVQIDVQVATSAATVRADARLLRQAMVNLLLNAFQSMPRGGLLEVRAGSGLLDEKPCAEISIRDSGAGIPPEALSRIFQPFFTTKATGTGLGLAVVRRIVEGHGGAVAVGRPASGAEFLVRLPLSR